MARDFIRLEENYESIANEGALAFDVCFDEDAGWIIQTSYCQLGGCLADYIRVLNQEEGIRLSAKMTYFEEKPRNDGLCAACRTDLYQMQE